MLALPVAPLSAVDVEIAENGRTAPAPRRDVDGYVSWRAGQKGSQLRRFLRRHRIFLRSVRIVCVISVLQNVCVRQGQAFNTLVLRPAGFVSDGGLR
jgi:hypothetical protein